MRQTKTKKQTPFIIDAHTHVARFGSPSNTYEGCLEALRREAKKNGVSLSIIIGGFKVQDGLNASTARLLRLTQSLRDVRVVGSIDALKYTRTHFNELEQWLKQKRVVGLKLYTGYQHFFPNNARCTPLYKLCVKYNVPVIFHSGDTLAGYVENPKLIYSHPLHIDDIAVDFPKLKIIIAHIGNPWIVDCAEIIYKNPNVYADISGLFAEGEVDPWYQKLISRRLNDLITYTGSDKLIFGSDWPVAPVQTSLQLVEKMNLSQTDRARLLRGTAADLFRL